MTTHINRNVDGTEKQYDYVNMELLDIRGAPIKVCDDFVTPTADTGDWTIAGVNSGTAAALASGIGGVLRITTGALDDDDVDVASALVFQASKGIVMEARVAINDVDKLGVFIGFADATGYAADTLAMTYAANALVSSAADAAGFIADVDATDYHVICASVDTNVDTTEVLTTVTPADAVYHIYRIEISPTGTATYYIDGVLVATIALALTITVPLCAYIGVINHGESAANTVDVDYVRAFQLTR